MSALCCCYGNLLNEHLLPHAHFYPMISKFLYATAETIMFCFSLVTVNGKPMLWEQKLDCVVFLLASSCKSLNQDNIECLRKFSASDTSSTNDNDSIALLIPMGPHGNCDYLNRSPPNISCWKSDEKIKIFVTNRLVGKMIYRLVDNKIIVSCSSAQYLKHLGEKKPSILLISIRKHSITPEGWWRVCVIHR